jgi:hypothetical protein
MHLFPAQELKRARDNAKPEFEKLLQCDFYLQINNTTEFEHSDGYSLAFIKNKRGTNEKHEINTRALNEFINAYRSNENPIYMQDGMQKVSDLDNIAGYENLGKQLERICFGNLKTAAVGDARSTMEEFVTFLNNIYQQDGVSFREPGIDIQSFTEKPDPGFEQMVFEGTKKCTIM